MELEFGVFRARLFWRGIVLLLLAELLAELVVGGIGAEVSPGVVARTEAPRVLTVDPHFPGRLIRADGSSFFLCGPGDPEGFLYRGERRADGTRDGDQRMLIDKLIRHGGNSIYMQVVRSHGGDGGPDENPFVDSDPVRGLNDEILQQWETWFDRMDANDIVIYLHLYDDNARIWGTPSTREVSEEEEAFVVELVHRFRHHQNLIWVVAEESEEAIHPERIRRLAEIITREDRPGRVVGNHHHSGTEFKAWSPGCVLDLFSMQWNRAEDEEIHRGAVAARAAAEGRYLVVYAENTEARGEMRQVWASAMAGLMPMVIGMDIASTPPEDLKRCRALSEFFEASDYYRMSPADILARGGTRWVLADAGERYLAYADSNRGPLGLAGMKPGNYTVQWLDCASGDTVVGEDVMVAGSTHGFPRPEGIGFRCILRATRNPGVTSVFPGAEWDVLPPADLGLDPKRLEEAARMAGGRGCVIRHGYLTYSWGDIERSGDLASAGKPVYSHLLWKAIEDGRLPDAEVRVASFQPCLTKLNSDLGYPDREMTFRHLAFQTACLGYREAPGTAFDYNDATMGFFWDVLVERVFETRWEESRERLFKPYLILPLQLQDPVEFATEGRMAGRLAMSPRDFARFGLLYLRQGRWGDKQLLRRAHAVRAVTDPLPLSVPRTQAEPAEACATRSIGGGGNQTDHNGGYSWLWWINGVARDGRRWWFEAPPGIFAALGHCGQRGVAALPQFDLVVSWNDTRELHCDRELGNRFFSTLAAAVRE